MERTFASVCVVLLSFVGCLGQETVDSQTSTDSPAKVDWDTTDTPLTETNADVQLRNGVPSPSVYQDYETFLSNPWGPMLMQMNMSPYGERVYNRRSRYETQGNLDLNGFLRRPDAYYPRDWNDTTPQRYDDYPIDPNYQPYPPKGVFYPQSNLDPNPKNVDYPDQSDSSSDQEDTQSQEENNPPSESAISQPPNFYRPPLSRPYSNRDQQFYYPPMNYFWQNQDNIRRAQDNQVPPSPYPYPPGFYPPGGPPTYPQVNVFVQPPTSEDKSLPAGPEITAERRQSVPEPSPPAIPPPNNLPPYPLRPKLPYPPNPYLFGYPPLAYPPPIVPGLLPRPTPIIPNIPPPNNNNLIDTPVQDLLRPPRREDLPPLPPPPKTVPDVVNVDVIAAPESDAKPSEGLIPYKFGYDMNDGLGTDQHRQESSDGSGVVTGSYSYRDPNGVYRVVNYIADKDGFRASVKTNEPGVANPGSADVVVFAERPPLKTVVEGLRRSDVEVAVARDQSEIEVEKK